MKYCLLFCSILLMTSCTSTKVYSDVDQSQDFTQFTTFEYAGWTNDSDQFLNRLDKERIEQAFTKEANNRGLKQVERDGDVIACLYLTLQPRTEQRANTTTTSMGGMNTMGGMHRRGMRSPGWGWGMGTAHSSTVVTTDHFVEGTLMAELYDKDDKELIWRALGTERVNENPKKRAKDIQRVISYIMNEYPIKPAKK